VPPQVAAQPLPKAAVEVMPKAGATPPHGFAVSKSLLFGGIAGLVVVLAVAGTVYAYVEKIGPFAHVPYTQDNLLSGLLQSFSKIQSSSYTLSGSVAVGPRDPDAKPFTLTIPNAAEVEEQYRNDVKRTEDVSTMMGILKYAKTYPRTIGGIASANTSKYYASSFATTDPKTRQPYGYVVAEDGKNFALTVSFETNDAIKKIRQSYDFSSSTTQITGNTVIFTKDSPYYIYLSHTPPKPFLVQLSDLVRMAPSEMHAKLSVGAQSDWSKKDADWKFNANATADFGDLSFKIDFDALRTDSLYYVRLNNIPSIFGSSLAAYKGTWISIDPAATSTQEGLGYSYSSYVKSLSSNESEYKKSREEAVQFMLAAVAIADKEHLLSFGKPPYAEVLNGQRVYRYDLSFNKESILAFYQQLGVEARKYPTLSGDTLFDDPGMVEYLKSDAFSQVFDYVSKNTTLTVWVDTDGYLTRVSYGMRLVPPDTAVMLKDKQVNASIDLLLTDINTPVRIDTPTGAKPLQEIMGQVYTNLYEYDKSVSTSTIKGK
jgi:hypothetical protein